MLARLLSPRTISGKLIIGLFVLFGLASVVVSLVTAASLSSSLMSSLDGQLQAATSTWFSCVNMAYHDGDGGSASRPGRIRVPASQIWAPAAGRGRPRKPSWPC